MKRILVFLLTVTMLLSLPVTAFADGDGTEAPGGATIKLDRESVSVTKNGSIGLVVSCK